MESRSTRTQYSNNIWVDSLRPKKLDELVGNKKAVAELKSWLEAFTTNSNSSKDPEDIKNKKKINKASQIKASVIIFGPHGVGKSITVELLLEKLGYEIKNINYNVIKERLGTAIATGKKKDDVRFFEVIKSMVEKRDVTEMIYNQKPKKTAIVIDELESISSPNDKSFFMRLQKMNNQEWMFPMIFISDDQHSKLLTEIKKNAQAVHFWKPTNDDMLKMLDRLAKSQKIKFSSLAAAQEIVEYSQYDFRRLVTMTQELWHTYGGSVWSEDDIRKYIEFVKKKDMDGDLYNIAGMMLYEYKNIDDTLRCHEMEKVLFPLMIQENFIKTITRKGVKCSKKELLKLAEDITESLSIGDVVENHIYSDQNWNLNEVHGFYACVNTSYNLCKIRGKLPWTIRDFEFPQDLNKTSIKKINFNKHIAPTKRALNDKNEFDCLFINNIICKMLLNGKLDECVTLLQQYTTNANIMDSLLKVDKVLSDGDVIDEYYQEDSIIKTKINPLEFPYLELSPTELEEKIRIDLIRQYNKLKTQMIGMVGVVEDIVHDDQDVQYEEEFE